VAALVQHEARELRSPSERTGHNLLCVGHLRYAVVAHERHGLDPRHARRRQAADECRPSGGRQRLRFVLQPVARADVADQDVHER
jgi:hypothetical protein